MAGRKYRLLKDDTDRVRIPPEGDNYRYVTVYRIQGLDGRKGGYVESEGNLDQEGDCWIDEDCYVVGNAFVMENAQVEGDWTIFGDTQLRDNASLSGDGYIGGNSVIRNSAKVKGVRGNDDKHPMRLKDVVIEDMAEVEGNLTIFGKDGRKTVISDKTTINAQGTISNSRFDGNATVDGLVTLNNVVMRDRTKINATTYGGGCVIKDTTMQHQAYINGRVKMNSIVNPVLLEGTSSLEDDVTVSGGLIMERNSHVTENVSLTGNNHFEGTGNASGHARISGSNIRGDVSDESILNQCTVDDGCRVINGSNITNTVVTNHTTLDSVTASNTQFSSGEKIHGDLTEQLRETFSNTLDSNEVSISYKDFCESVKPLLKKDIYELYRYKMAKELGNPPEKVPLKMSMDILSKSGIDLGNDLRQKIDAKEKEVSQKKNYGDRASKELSAEELAEKLAQRDGPDADYTDIIFGDDT